jgi:hypothetical protein
MTASKLMYDAEHWRDRAEEARAAAEQPWSGDELRRQLLDMAAGYDRLAEAVERRLRPALGK